MFYLLRVSAFVTELVKLTKMTTMSYSANTNERRLVI